MIDIANVKEIAASDAIADMLRKYKFVTGALFNTDVSDDYTFQDAYCDLYRLNDGYSEKFIIGGSIQNDSQDDCGPDIRMYMNHNAFLSGDKVNETPVLFAEISDKNGINASGSGIGHEITLTLSGNPAARGRP